jgi:uncharacterized membrane protein
VRSLVRDESWRPRPPLTALGGAAEHSARTMMRVVQFTYVFLYALVAGVFWGTWFSLSRSMAELAPTTFLEVGHTMIQNLGGPMSLLIPLTLVLNVAAAILLYRQRQTQAFALTSAALLLLVAALLITLSVNVPIDNEIARWTLTTLPAGWETVRDQWEWYHALRTFASLVLPHSHGQIR